jgi:MtN3 and saliva related transmembrane protein
MDFISIIGLSAAVCTTISFLPQTIKTIKTKQIKGLSLIMYSLLTFGLFLWFIYGFLRKDYPIIIANGISLFFSAIILYMIIRYRKSS